MSIVINILAAIGLLVIISYAIYYLYVYIKKIQTNNEISLINPPPNYMQNTGIRCPDYWVNTGVDSNGNYICKNSFNIQTNNNPNCPSQMNFTSIPSSATWEYNNPDGLTSLTDTDKYKFLKNSSVGGSISRCDWVNQCGAASNVQGIWTGVNEICNSPP